jgi:hypothetical protein
MRSSRVFHEAAVSSREPVVGQHQVEEGIAVLSCSRAMSAIGRPSSAFSAGSLTA